MLSSLVSAMIAPLRHRTAARRNRAVAAVEFGILAPLFVIILAGTVDLGDAVYTRTLLDGALAAGTNFAVVNASKVTSVDGQALANHIAQIVSNSNGGTAANATVVVNNGPSTTMTNGTPTTSGTAGNADLYYCPTGSPPSWTWGSSVASGTSCTGGGTAGKFVTVTVSLNFAPLFPAYNFVHSGAITIGSAVQTQ
jgi:Flp pilus assembly protein TadG